MYEIEGILRCTNNEVVRRFLQESGYDSYVWTERIPDLINELRRLRNKAAHGRGRILKSEANRARAILIVHGLLAEFATALYQHRGHT